MKKNKLNIICWILTPFIILGLIIGINVKKVPDIVFLREGKSIQSSKLIKLDKEKINNNINQIKISKKRRLSLLGILPLKQVNVQKVPDLMVYPGGQPIGIKINTKGVMVVGLSDIETENGKVQSPAVKSGIEIGDSILKINKKEINSAEDLASEVLLAKDKEIKITIKRKNEIIYKKVTPIKCKNDNKYKIGLWVRDSTAGVGTLTFYDDKTKNFSALGHPITDIDTGAIIDVNKGTILPSSIISVRKGVKGNPGELRGIFLSEDRDLGNIYKNTECGIFGKANRSLINNTYNRPLRIALRDEIKEGPAQIITTINGEKSKAYNIYIEKLLPQSSPGPKSMVIKVTDKELLEKTGGIVQGMSGSPIIQDNKLVGAVTHVLINKPDVGYGIYIEWMLKEANVLK